MKRRTVIWLGSLLVGGLVAGASAGAIAAHGRGQAMMQRVAAGAIDEALDQAQVTPEQRAAIHGARDRLFTLAGDHWKARPARLEAVLALFEADQVDTDRLLALRRQIEEEHAKIADAVGQALVEAHDVLTAPQRKALADYVRAHRHPMH
ncbi:MAG: hypothetical protein AUH29_07450 [Candidatus Rokubacteria bacterium 13_1_40CM_69_27]|nr:MAG: hypothetical protein AUH29_07450 [Candidatus Rokubacteria bacterium 13_1_40CM_69_27]OLC34726.1 MAG: hypothetical protein AUH81_11685 [Candidatus Rokubacteria bacterium 13_1_40CM_4_69_5]